MRRKILLLSALLFGFCAAYAQGTVTIPAGQFLKAKASTPLSSEFSTKGQGVSFTLESDFVYNGQVIAQAGSSVVGTVIDVSKSKRGSVDAKLLVRFNMIITRNGGHIPISAVIKTNDNTGVLSGGAKATISEEYTPDIAANAGAGVLAGIMIAPIAGGSVGKGTAVATAVGAAGDTIKTVYDRGEDVLVPVNSTVLLVLTQALTITPEPPEINHN